MLGQFMHTLRVNVVHRKRAMAAKLLIEAAGRCNQVWRPQRGFVLAVSLDIGGAAADRCFCDAVCDAAWGAGGRRRLIREQDLGRAVVADSVQDVIGPEAVIKHAKPAAHHGLRRALAATDAISDGQSRREVMVIAGKVVLGFIPEAVAQGQVGKRLPIILGVEAKVGIRVVDVGALQFADRELRRNAGEIAVVGCFFGWLECEVRVGETAVGVARRVLGFARGAQASAKANEVLFERKRGVVLHLEVILVIGGVLHRSATGGQRALHGDKRRVVEWKVGGAVALPLETGFVDQLGAEGLRVAELQLFVACGGVVRGRGQGEIADA